MKKVRIMTALTAAVVLAVSIGFAAEEQKEAKGPAVAEKKQEAPEQTGPQIMLMVPLFSEHFSETPLALVNNEPIRLEDLLNSLGMAHQERHEPEKQLAKVDYATLLHRLINVKLMAQDAKSMDMADLPDIKEDMDSFSKNALKKVLIGEVTKDVQAPEEDVQQIYRESIREWKIKSVMFTKEDDAKKMGEDVRAGKNFDEAVSQVLDEKLAEGSKEGSYVKPETMQQDLAAVVSKMEAGAVSPVIKIDLGQKGPGYVILKLEDVRYPDNEEAKERASVAVLTGQKNLAVRKFNAELRKKYLKSNDKLIKALDFESPKPGFEKLLKDKRVLVEIKKGKPVTVADLAAAFQTKYFHGLETAIKSKKVNKYKLEMLGEILEDRLYREEALSRGLDKSVEYKKRVREHETTLLFGTYVNKVLIPGLKITEEDLKAYYEGHKKDYTYPEMMRLESLVFARVNDAEDALAKLKQGADLKWMKSNMEGQVPKDTAGLHSFEGNVVMVTEMPEGMQKALSGARPADVRLYESPEGHFYVLSVQDVVPTREQPFEEVQQTIYNKVFEAKLQDAVEEWAGKLKAAGTVEVYLVSQDKETDISKAK